MAASKKNGKLDLIGTFEAHLILGVERSRIARFLHDNARGKGKIAEPAAEPQCGPIWKREEIIETAKQMHVASGTGETFEEWMAERAARRAAALPNPLTPDDLEGIIRCPLLPAGRKLLLGAGKKKHPVAA